MSTGFGVGSVLVVLECMRVFAVQMRRRYIFLPTAVEVVPGLVMWLTGSDAILSATALYLRLSQAPRLSCLKILLMRYLLRMEDTR